MNQQTKVKSATAPKKLKLKVAPLRNLGVDKLVGGDVKFQGCRATQGGSCHIDCTC